MVLGVIRPPREENAVALKKTGSSPSTLPSKTLSVSWKADSSKDSTRSLRYSSLNVEYAIDKIFKH